MGSFFSTFSKDDSENHKEIANLKERLVNVENLDRDNDGVVTKSELDLWISEQKRDIEEFKKKVEESSDLKYQTLLNQNERELNDTRQEIKKLQAENDALKDVNRSLEKRLKSDKEFRDVAKTFSLKKFDSEEETAKTAKKISTELSRKRIDAVVEQLLADPEVNIKYFPDGIERQIYRNIFTIMINLLDNVVDTTSINFMGHKLVLDLQPMSDDEAEIAEKENTVADSKDSTSSSKEEKSQKKRGHKFRGKNRS